ncbi:MAG: S1 RNA-binding domain-containing protein, partial [Treponemataceae bacterium]|nr:S1 RNA-binding domain-containing protein [Treponemataceae bacterium]
VVAFGDLTVGMKVTGKIKNVVDFGAFVDIGLHETALIHISELSDRFVSDPMDVIKVGDVKEFTIIALDTDRKRISLSLKSDAGQRLAGVSTGSATAEKAGAGRGKKVVVVKKGAGNANRPRPHGNDRPRRDYGSDDGMSYNPFAAAFAKMKK